MALNIESATIGYNANNVEAAINSMNEHVIADTISLMNQKMEDLRTAVDAVWVGKSADQFKKNMESDKDFISKSLEEAKEILNSEIYQIVNALAERDENLVPGREY